MPDSMAPPEASGQGYASHGPSYEGGPQEWNLHAIQRILWQRRYLIASIATMVLLVTFVVTILRTPLYEASARVNIERSTPKVLESEDVVPMVWNEFEIQRFYQTQYLLVRDEAVLRRALDYKGLREDLLRARAPEEGRADGQEPPDDADLAKWIGNNLELQQLEYSNIIKVSLRHPDPKLAARIVNAVVHTYQDFFVQQGTEGRMAANDLLESQIQERRAEVLDLQTLLQVEREKLGTVLAAADATEIGRARLSTLDDALTQAKKARVEAEARLRGYENSTPMGIELVRSHPHITKYLGDLAEMQRELAELEGRVGPDWPRLRELRRAVSETRLNLDERAASLFEEALDNARSDLEVAMQNERRLENLFREELDAASSLKRRAQDYDSLYQEYEQKRASLDRLLERREEVALTTNLESVLRRQVAIVAEATPPEQPAVPRVKLSLALGMAFGLFLGVAGAFLAEALDNKVRGPGQLGELTRLPVLGSVPRVEGPARPRLAFSRKKRGTTPVMAARQNDAEESFRALRSALLLSQAGHPPRSLLITSALPGEGKSTVVANLARTLAAFGSRVCIIDADLRHPRLHRVFKTHADRGLTNVLASGESVTEVLAETPYDKLALIPGGPCPPDPATLLDGARLRAIIDELSGPLGFDFVIVDTPPTLVFADTFSIVRSVEGVILVARAMQTPKDAIRQAREGLRKVNAPMLGVLLNGETSDDNSGSYYRYYHYRKGYYRRVREERGAAEERGGEDGSSSRESATG